MCIVCSCAQAAQIAEIVQPVIRHQTASGRVLIATSAAYLETCLSGKTSVWDDDSFATAMEGLPEEGNGLKFVSAKFAKEYLRIYDDFFKAMAAENQMPAGVGEMLIGLLKELGLSPDHSQALVMTNLPEGVLIVGNTVASAKQSVVGAGAAAAAVFGAGMFNMKSSHSASVMLEEEAAAHEATLEGIELKAALDAAHDKAENEAASEAATTDEPPREE